MAIPWVMAVKAAEALFSSASARRAAATSNRQLQGVTERLAALEKDDEATAQLLVQLTEQVQALTRAAEIQATRVRWLLVATVVSVIVATAALIVITAR